MPPTHHADLLREAIAAARRGNKAETRTLLDAVLETEPDNEMALLWLASVTESANDGIVLLERVLSVNPANTKASAGILSLRLQLGVAAAKARRKPEARRLLMMVVSADARNESAWLWLAGVAETPKEAMECLNRVLAVNPANKQALAGMDWYKTQMEARAAPAFECFICKRKAGTRNSRCVACNCVIDLEKIDLFWAMEVVDPVSVHEAVSRLERGARATPRSAVLRIHLALAYFNLHRFSEGYIQLHSAAKLRAEDAGLKAVVDRWAVRIGTEAAHSRQKDSSRRLTILAVDDSPTVRKLVSVTLERHGHRVIEASDGYAALASLETNGLPDLVLLDIMMPGIDGYQVCRMLRQNAEMANRPIVMLSGKDGFFSKIRGKMAGSTDYVTKPFKPEALLELVEKYCPVAAR